MFFDAPATAITSATILHSNPSYIKWRAYP